MTRRTYIRDGRAPIPNSDNTSHVMSCIKDKNTTPELILRKALRSIGLNGYRLHWSMVPGSPDICYVGKKIAIFVNGCFWHRCPHCSPPFPKSNIDFWREKFDRNIARDKKKIDMLEKKGWKAIVIWECEIKNSLHVCLDNIQKLVEYEK